MQFHSVRQDWPKLHGVNKKEVDMTVDVTTGNYSYVDDDGFVYRDITDELGVTVSITCGATDLHLQVDNGDYERVAEWTVAHFLTWSDAPAVEIPIPRKTPGQEHDYRPFNISTVAARQSKFIIRRLHFNEEMIKRENTIDDDVRMWNKPFLTINVRLIAVYGKQAVIIREIESEPFLFFTSVSDEEVLLDVRELQYRNEQDEVAQLTAVVSKLKFTKEFGYDEWRLYDAHFLQLKPLQISVACEEQTFYNYEKDTYKFSKDNIFKITAQIKNFNQNAPEFILVKGQFLRCSQFELRYKATKDDILKSADLKSEVRQCHLATELTTQQPEVIKCQAKKEKWLSGLIRDKINPLEMRCCKYCGMKQLDRLKACYHTMAHIRMVRVQCSLCGVGAFFDGHMYSHLKAEELMYVVADLYSKPPGQAVFTNGQIISSEKIDSVRPFLPDPEIEKKILGQIRRDANAMDVEDEKLPMEDEPPADPNCSEPIVQNHFKLRVSVVARTLNPEEDVTLYSFTSDRISVVDPWNALDFASKKGLIPIV